jgi:hypothetical membrane protein
VPRVAIGLAVVFALTVVTLHVVRTDVDPLARGVSRYAVGSYGYVVNGAFLILALALVETGRSFRRDAPNVGTIGVWLLWASAAGMALVALFPLTSADSTGAENLPHQIGGMIFFLAAAAGTVAMSRATGRLTVLAWSITAAVTVYFLSIGVRPLGLTGIRGLLQRACFAAIVAWLILVNATHVRKVQRRQSASSTP